ncbi:adenylate/guanylate cyclase domain-containing protein [Thioalkalivibrio sp. ALJT]|uniref:adenylate/guanylate cyclase domain-containing protein n=1 Tax=Thioalkalivibrio sp. ALJT TaxID=1158146 RepID=UPI0003613010|nr:adenylate/guanylate cyclase domain-containing protein [Thioalkalivibrio sp. ALJT]
MRLGFSAVVQLLFVAMMIITVTLVAATGYSLARSGVVDAGTRVIDGAMERTRDRFVERYTETGDRLALLASGLKGLDALEQRDSVFRSLWELAQQSELHQSSFMAGPDDLLLEARSLPNPATRFVPPNNGDALEEWIYRDDDFSVMTRLTKPRTASQQDAKAFDKGAAPEDTRFSEVHPLSLTGAPGITVSRPVQDAEGAVNGVVGIEIPLARLEALLRAGKLGEESMLMIISDDNKVVAHHLGPRPGRDAPPPGELLEVADLRQQWIADAWMQLRAKAKAQGDPEVTLLDLEPGNYFVQKKRLTEHLDHDWHLFLMVPDHAVLAGVNRGLHTSVTLATIMMIVAAYAIFLTASKLTRPLRQMVDNARLLEQLRFGELRPVQGEFSEFNALDRSLRQMASSLMAFNRYVPTALLRRLLSEKHEATLGAECRSLVLMNTGINEFNTTAAEMETQEEAEYLTRYQREIFEAVHRNGGAIDKFIDDRIIVFWGAPDAAENDTYHACTAALECQAATHQLSQALRWENHPAITLRVGLHRDVCMVGNFGSEDRMFYSVVGGAVSVNNWLGNLNRRYGTTILASEAIRSETTGDFVWRWIDRVEVFDGWNPSDGEAHSDRGEPFDIYELRGHAADPGLAQQRDYVARYEAALALRVNEKDLERALERFYALHEQFPGDDAVAWQVKVIRAMLEDDKV